jgi:hypothetical protein
MVVGLLTSRELLAHNILRCMFIFRRKIYKEKCGGFMMAEAVLSMFVLAVGLVAIMALLSSSTRQSFNSRDSIIAVELSQEGVELVRNVRDNGFINTPDNPFRYTGAFSASAPNCRIDYNSIPSAPNLVCVSSPAPAPPYFVLLSSGGYYNHTSGTPTKFSRYIYINYNGSDSAKVTSFVYWGAAAIPAGITSGTTTNCTVSSKCVYTQVTLSSWRG